MAPAEDLQDAALVLYDDGSVNTKVGRAGAVEILLRHARPDVAAGVAVFGVGISALPFLARFQGVPAAHRDNSGQKAFAYAAFSDEVDSSSSPGLLTKEELLARLGALDPAAVAAELQMEHREVLQHAASPAAGLDKEVERLQRWHAEAQSAVASLERRSALAFLGLGSDAEADAIQKSYKQRVLTAHPDKGGSEEDFQQLQDMVARLQEEDAEGVAGLVTANRGENLFQTLAKRAKQNRKAKEEEEEEEAMPLSKEVKLKQSRLKLHDRTLELWQRAKEAQRQLGSGANGQAQNRHSLALLRQFVDGFASEAETLTRGAGASAAAERLLCRFVRQGLEVLTAAALVDCAEVVRLVALNFTAILVRVARGAGPCPRLEQRCQFLLEALADVPKDFDKFLGGLQNRLENQNAAEWRGCDETRAAAPNCEERADPGAGPPAPDAAACPTEPSAAGTAGGPNPEAPSRADPFALAVSSFAAASREAGAESAVHEPAPPAPARVDPFAAAVAAFAAANGKVEEHPKAQKLPEVDLVRVAEPAGELQQRPGLESKASSAYHQTEEWGKIRAHCVRMRLCVNFNRDSGDRRCTAPAGACGFKHACAVCGAEERGGPGAQYQCHGAWNCSGLAAWLMVHK